MIDSDLRVSLLDEAFSRREFFALLGGVGLLVLEPGCSPTEAEREARADLLATLQRALRARVAEPRRFQTPAEALAPTVFPIAQDDAADRLVGTLPSAQVAELVSDGTTLLTFLEARSKTDYAAARVHYVEGWLLSETEVCVFVLAAGT